MKISALLLLCTSFSCSKQKLTLPTERAVYHNNQGIVALNENDLERAAFEFKTAIELASHYVEAYNNLGIVYKARGELAKAASQFERAIALEPKYGAAYSHLGAVYLAQGKTDAAIEVIQKGIKKEGTLADAHYNLGLAYIQKTREDKDRSYIPLAEAALRKATELNANLPYVHEQLADIYREVGDYEHALIRYRLAIGDAPQSAHLWLKLGELHLQKNEPYKAQNAFQKALDLDPNSADAHMRLGLFYLGEKRYQEATAEFRSVVALNPFDELGWFRIGAVLLETADGAHAAGDDAAAMRAYNEAATAFSKAKEINPAFADAIFNLGLVYLKQHRQAQAIKEWELAIRVDPKHGRSFYNLATAYQLDGRPKEAAAMFCRFLGAAGGKYPAEREAARRVIAEAHYSCPQ